MKHIILAFVLCWATASFAESWQVARSLSITPDEQLDVTFQPLAEFSETENLIHGWKGDELHYVVITDRQPGGKPADTYWKTLLSELKASSDNKKLNVLKEGKIDTEAGDEVTYKHVSLMVDGVETHQMLGLIIGKEDAYWIMSMPFSDDIDYMINSSKALLKTSAVVE